MMQSPTRIPLTSGLLVGAQPVTIDGYVVIRPQGMDDGWQVTTFEHKERMEHLTLETKRGCAPVLTRRLLGNRRGDDWSWKIAKLPGVTHEDRVKQVVALMKGQSLTHGTEAA